MDLINHILQMGNEVLDILSGLPTAKKCQSTDFEPISLTPHLVLIPDIPLSNKEHLGEHSFLFPFLPSVLSPNIAHIVEWNSKEIEINSFLLKFLFSGVIPSSYVNHGSTSTSSL